MIYSEEYMDFMFNYLQIIEGVEEFYHTGCVNEIEEDIAIIHTPYMEDGLTNLELVPYSYIPKLFGLMDSSNMEAIGVKQVQNPNNVGLTGQNVIVGVIDTGIDYTNPLFRDRNGESRIGVLWDQTIRDMENGMGVPSPYFGTTFSREQINAALAEENPYDSVPSRDEDGHGTFMAGIAAGGKSTAFDFTGIATDAELAVVRLKESKTYLKRFFGVPEDVPAYQETDIIYAIDYLLQYADSPF